MHYDMKKSGERIRQLRVQNEYTQDELARMLTIDRSLLSHIEAGKRGCSVDLLVRICDYFKVSLNYIVLGETKHSLQESPELKLLKSKAESLMVSLEAFVKGH